MTRRVALLTLAAVGVAAHGAEIDFAPLENFATHHFAETKTPGLASRSW